MQVLNGAIAAALFNLLYDLVLSQKVKWYAMCPVVDCMNHNSAVQVSIFRSYTHSSEIFQVTPSSLVCSVSSLLLMTL